ncbi:MAG: hypothetical protein KY410_01395 [Proteobacteria bacterium]|nr:hypothetical protein [Pseudomonadota bacterium]
MSEIDIPEDYNVVLHRGCEVGDDVLVSWCYPEVGEVSPIRLRVIDVDNSEAEAYLTAEEAADLRARLHDCGARAAVEDRITAEVEEVTANLEDVFVAATRFGNDNLQRPFADATEPQ